MLLNICIPYLFLVILTLASSINFAQAVMGRLVDENGSELINVNLNLYTAQNIYSTTSGSDGTFSFDNITSIRNEQLPTGYSISNNYPNPFNPKTRIIITQPKASMVKIDIYNMLGQNMNQGVEKYFSSGVNYIDLELNGLPNGVYFARISIDDKYSVVRKMMLLYASQHLITNDIQSQSLNTYVSKIQEVIFDSLVAENLIIGSKTFKDLPSFSEGTLDFGDLVIERYCEDARTVEYEGKIYHTVKIGEQCWLKENLDVGVMIESTAGGFQQTDNGIIEKYCYDNDPANCDTYGGLYEWPEAMQYVGTNGAQGICPDGWHMPTTAEVEALDSLIGYDASKLIDKNAKSGFTYTNESGFSALFSGRRNNWYGDFYNLDSKLYFWSSTLYSHELANNIRIISNSKKIFTESGYMSFGYCVRCIKD